MPLAFAAATNPVAVSTAGSPFQPDAPGSTARRVSGCGATPPGRLLSSAGEDGCVACWHHQRACMCRSWDLATPSSRRAAHRWSSSGLVRRRNESSTIRHRPAEVSGDRRDEPPLLHRVEHLGGLDVIL